MAAFDSELTMRIPTQQDREDDAYNRGYKAATKAQEARIKELEEMVRVMKETIEAYSGFEYIYQPAISKEVKA